MYRLKSRRTSSYGFVGVILLHALWVSLSYGVRLGVWVAGFAVIPCTFVALLVTIKRGGMEKRGVQGSVFSWERFASFF